LQGPITSFTGVGTIRSKQQFQQVCVTAGIHVVNQILWCGRPRQNTLPGCSSQPGSCMVVARRVGVVEPVLWAHEYGHTRNLHHSCEEPGCTPAEDDRLMHPRVQPGHVKIDQGECDLLR
jgi:hypothetical protein